MRKSLSFLGLSVLVLIAAPAMAADLELPTTDKPICSSGEVIDLTPEINLEYMGAGLTLLDTETRYPASNQKDSTARYDYERGGKRILATVNCTLTCTGLSCTMSGCDALAGNCTTYSCSGPLCESGSCTRKTEISEN